MFGDSAKKEFIRGLEINSMHEEFAVFLASQGINKEEWEQIKNTNILRVDELFETFSDLVWEKILINCKFLEYTSPDQIFLFETLNEVVNVYVIKVPKGFIDLTTDEGFTKVLNQLQQKEVNILQASRAYEPSRSEFIYNYLRKGATQSQGERFRRLQTYFSNSSK